MNKKLNRGIWAAVIGCLVASLFAIWGSLIKKEPLHYVEEQPFDKFTVSPQIVDSALSEEEQKRAFDMLLSERANWLSFRGIAGNITVTTEDFKSPKESVSSVCQGYIQLNLLNILHDGNKQRIPFETELIFAKSKSDPPLFTFFSDRNKNKKELKGDAKPEFDPAFVCQILTCPLEIFSGMPNKTIQDLITGKYWSVTKIDDAYIFKSNEKLTADECFAPTIEFKNGHISKFISKRYPNKPYVVFTFESIVDLKDSCYPCTLRLTVKNFEDGIEKTVQQTTIVLTEAKNP
jgi:hypothetical protein